jgi:glycosyltransferase involved in cell wall biosynthesis
MIETPTKIRVCFISLRAYPIFNPSVEKLFGGAEVDLYLLATELAKDPRFEVQFVVGDYGQPDVERIENVTLFKSLDVHKNLFLQGRKLWHALRQANAQIYMQEACSLSTPMIAALCVLHRRKFVYRTAHTDETDGTYFREHPFRKWFIQWAIRKAEIIITQNEKDVNDAIKTLGRKPCVIRNACRINPLPDSQRNGVLWVARSVSFKRPELFLRLADCFSEKNFIMICPKGTGDAHYERLLDAAEKVNNLTLIKRVPFHQIDRYFEQAAVFVNTSDSEGFPNTFVQACKNGTPILSLRVNPDGFLEAHNCGRCANGDWERFCAILRELTETPQGRELGLNGQSYIRRFHDIEDIVRHYKQLFMGLVGRADE